MKIDKKLIKELVDYLSEFNISEIEYQEGEKKIKVSRALRGSSEQTVTGAVVSPNKSVLSDVNEQQGTRVKSPIIGTAYLAPEPGGKKFAEVGKKINKGDTIMIVEAMKTMNHVPSPVGGTIKKICVEDGQPVEYGHTIAIIE